MDGLAQAIRSGNWVTAARVRGYSLIVLVLGAAMLAAIAVTADGVVDFQGRPVGTDFSNVYAGGKWVLEGRPEAPYSPASQHAMEKRVFGAETPFYGWHYPPIFLAVAALLALMPYGAALLVWQVGTFVSYVAAMRAIAPWPQAWLPILAFPAVTINAAHGQNGFLTAALFGGGLWLVDRRPAIAGFLLGSLCYKPQFGLLIPLVLAASGRWRAFGAAAVTVIALCAASWLGFGEAVWRAFFESLSFTREVVLEAGGTGFHKIQSPFAALRLWGAPVQVAYAVQLATAATVAVLLAIQWRSEAAFPLKAAALLSGALLATPYVLDYDLMLMAPAIAFLAAHGLRNGFLPYEKTALLFCWFAPLLTRGVGEFIGVPLGLIAVVILFGLAWRRGAVDRAPASTLAAA